MLQEMFVHIGDPVDPQRIEQSRQAIMDLGLFKSVKAELLPEEKGKLLRIRVEEKYYILPLPRLKRSADGDITYGAQIRLDNVAGLNQQVKLTYETKEVADSADGPVKGLSLRYVYPRIAGTPFSFNMEAGDARRVIHEHTDNGLNAEYQHISRNARFSITRQLDKKGPTRGWRLGGGLVWREERYQHRSGLPDMYQDGRAIALTGRLEYEDVRDYLYSRAGKAYGYQMEIGRSLLGTDQDYGRHEFYYRRYQPVSDKPHRTVNLRLAAGLSSGRLFGADAYTLGGSNTLRGYDRDSFSGDAFVLANLEYLTPLFDYNPLRGVVFVDVGNAYPSNMKINLLDLKSSVGLGLRFTVKWFVKVRLRIDAAYAVDTGDTRIYAGTKEAF